MRLAVALVAALAACGDDASGVDGGRDGAVAEDGSADIDGRVPPIDAPRTDGFTPPTAGFPPEPLAWEDCEGGGATLEADPSDYRSVLDSLAPGDTLRLRPGTYDRGLPISVSGEPGRCIVIEGVEEGGARPLFSGSDSFNLIAFRDASWVKVRHLDLDGGGLAGFGVASQDANVPVHHIVIEDLEMVGFDGDQQIVGISTKTPAWDWVIRGNRILAAGTGMYLGNSDGTQPFVRGLIERNLIVDTIGYNIEIKHQLEAGRGGLGLADLPSDAETIIRYNVFSKANRGSSGGDARPNLLVGHFPPSGSGASDRYLIYGNFFWQNPNESLFQGEGNVALYSNVLVASSGNAIRIQPHNDVPKQIDIFFNTILASGDGISITGGAAGYTQRAFYNVVFAAEPIAGGTARENLTAALAEASSALRAPTGTPGADLDLRPIDATVVMVDADLGMLSGIFGANLDFDGNERAGMAMGAYEPGLTGWALALEAR